MSLGPRRHRGSLMEEMWRTSHLAQLSDIIRSLQIKQDVQGREREWLVGFVAPLAVEVEKLFETGSLASRVPDHYPVMDWMWKRNQVLEDLAFFRAMNEALKNDALTSEQAKQALEFTTDLRRYLLDKSYCTCG